MRRAVRRSGGRAVGTWLSLIVVSLAVALTTPSPARLSARPPDRPTARPPDHLTAQTRFWRPEERVLISDFSVVDAVAASPWIVYAATRHGLLLYDRRARSWRLPVTTLEGYPSARVRTALADPAGNAVWLGTADGWARYDADLQRWDKGTAPGGVSALLLDASDAASGIFLRDLTGWHFLPRGALLSISGTPLPPPERRVQPLDVQTALATTPMAQAMRALILTDPRLRNYQFTGAARTPDNDELFMGTNGLGLVRIDATVGQWEPLTFTLLGARADALALGHDGVWVAGGVTPSSGGRSGVTWLASDLSATTPVEPAAGADFGVAAVRRLIAVSGALWIATDAGVFRLDPATGRTRRFGLEDGLPSEDVRALARSPDGVWIGTTRGLAVITGEKVVRVGTFSQPVTCLLATGDGDTLWVGSTAGLGVLTPGATEPVVPSDVAAEPALHAPIVALTRTGGGSAGGDTLVAVLEDQVAWRDPANAHWTVERPRATLGTLTTAAGEVGAAGVWLGGTIGLAWWDIGHGVYRRIDVPGDLPAAVRDIAAAAPWVWIATDSGAVRLSREAVTGQSRR